MAVMMKCGHVANGQDAQGKPVCVICVGITPGATEVAETPSLEGRTARCSYFGQCKHQVPSSLSLAFFSHHPDKQFDQYYCGCHGWD